MFSKLKNKWSNFSIVLKLSIFYTSIFSICLFIMFYGIYWITFEHMCQAKDSWVLEETKEIEEIFFKTSQEDLEIYLNEEANYAGINNAFYGLLNSKGEILISSNPKFFPKELRVLDNIKIQKEDYVFKTVKINNQMFRVLYRPFNGNVLQSVFSLREVTAYQYELTNLFVWAFVIMLCIFCSLGIFIIKSILLPVDIMTETANMVSTKNLKIRIPTGNNDELGKLANTLNSMLNKLDLLVTELKNVNENLAHDLRTLLSRICINIEISLLNLRTPEEYQKILVSSLEECRNIVEVLNTTLDISEVEAGIIAPKKEIIEINTLVTQIASVFIDIAKHQKINFIFKPFDDELFVQGDTQRIRQAILNIFDNALKYTPVGQEINITTTKNDKYAIIQVADTGIGINPQDIDKIFKRFYRADKARSLTGSGLGLALSNAIISAHGGFITVSSQINHGSIFCICIPLCHTD